MGIVKIPHHGADAHVLSPLGKHLGLLNGGDAVLGVEHQDLRLLHVGKTLHGGLAGITGGSRQDTGRPGLSRLFQGRGQ
ncbi:hypothetical protein SDC9_105256 [bioreactor metagenome]|uniref:Uncharacterized protein n=1 Tax=bioreactor metagenome TaxID=1076179 RepID=A0A645AYV0_9ZZZZ